MALIDCNSSTIKQKAEVVAKGQISTVGKSKRKRDGSTLRKAPQAPKRFKSSYILFFVAKQEEIKALLGPGASVGDVSKKSSELWKNLSVKERAHWDEVATRDKQRFMAEKATYTGPWQVPWKRAKKDPSAPKRPMSAFLYFSQDKRRALKKDNPGMRNTEISRILGELWRNTTENERKPHIDREARERKRYKVVIAQWRKEDKIRKEEQKRAQAEHAKMLAQQQSMYPATNRADGPYGSYAHDGQHYGYYNQYQQTPPQEPYNGHFPGSYAEPQEIQRQAECSPIYPVDQYNQVSQTMAAPTDYFPQQYVPVPAPPPDPHAGYHLNSNVPRTYQHPNSAQQYDYDIDPTPLYPFEPERVHFASN